jgi:Flp pilus assembly protein TadG
MIMTSLKNLRRHLATRRKALQRGVSAVEFAMIAPVMVLMLFGATEISMLVTIDRKTTLAASTLGDLAAQTDLVSCAELSQISAVTRQVFEPYSGANASLVVASVTLVGGVPKVEWSKFVQTISGTTTCNDVPGTHSLVVGNTVSIDPAMFATGGGIVIGDVENVYNSVGTSFMPNPMILRERFYLRPRKSLKLRYCLDTGPGVTANNCNTTT